MPAKSLICIAICKVHADEIISLLQEAGFPDNDLSVLFHYQTRARSLGRQTIPNFCQVRTGGMSSVGIKSLAITGTLAVPGVGLIVAAGDIAALICVAAVRTEPGGIASALVGLGIGASVAEHHQSKIHGGNILISVNTNDPNAESCARQILEEAGAEDIATTGEAAISSRPLEEKDTFAHHE